MNVISQIYHKTKVKYQQKKNQKKYESFRSQKTKIQEVDKFYYVDTEIRYDDL